VHFKNLDIEVVIGSAHDDTLDNSMYNSAEGGTHVEGRGGSDYIISSELADTLYGDSGTGSNGNENTVSYRGHSAAVIVDLQATQDFGQQTGNSDLDTLRDFINVEGSQFADTIYGDNRNNKLFGLNGADDLFGRSGNDILLGGNGGDRLFGELGADLLDGESGPDFLFGGVDIDTLIVDWAELATNPDKQIFGGGESDIFAFRNVTTNLGPPTNAIVVIPSRVTALETYLEDLVQDNKSDFNEGTDSGGALDRVWLVMTTSSSTAWGKQWQYAFEDLTSQDGSLDFDDLIISFKIGIIP
jgi:Ca2+-binding RTX toxin-like protein